MNTINDDTMMDDARFDRLVDGELNENERRELLESLDTTPGGWRSCALAFLESQCWKDSFRLVGRSELAKRSAMQQVSAAERPQPVRSRWASHFGTPLAVAASFLLAFWIGSYVQEIRKTSHPGGGEVAMAPTAVHHAPTAPATGPSLAQMTPSSKATTKPWRMVTVSDNTSPSKERSPLRVPAVERDDVDTQWVRSVPSAMPDNVAQAFQRTGHQIEQQRELVPVQLQDGRDLVVPVDNVKVHYVGNESY